MVNFLQFGTSRFLQAHVDLFIDEAMGPDQICVVQSSGDASRRARLDALAAPNGYEIKVRGMGEDGRVDRSQQVRAVSHCLSTASDWGGVCEEALNCKFILSNVSEKGYAPTEADENSDFDQGMSFVAKLELALLYRFENGGEPLTIFPLELFEQNGDHLKGLILVRAEKFERPAGFVDWLNRSVWVNSLVDRIVSEPIEPAGAIAEPYALWAIENQDGLAMPFEHANVQLFDDLEEALALKIYILNLSHTYLTECWNRAGLDERMTVAAYLADEERRSDLKNVLSGEVLPAFEAAGLAKEAKAYIESTFKRFDNPYLDHFIADIYAGHAQKLVSRIGGFLDWARSKSDAGTKAKLEDCLGG